MNIKERLLSIKLVEAIETKSSFTKAIGVIYVPKITIKKADRLTSTPRSQVPVSSQHSHDICNK